MTLSARARASKARFERLALVAIRSGFAALDRISPGVAAQCAETLLRTPPSARLTPRERRLLASGRPGFSRTPVGRLAIWQWGEGPSILLVHGWGGHAGRLAQFAAPVAALGFSVLAFDAPGHGASSTYFGTIFELIDAIRALDDRYGPFAGVIGHSLGASAAVLSMRRGVKFPRAVLLAPPADLGAYLPRFARRFALRPRTRDLLKLRLEDRYGIRWERLRLGSFSGPAPKAEVLVFHDSRDARVPLRDGAAIARAWPGARLVRTNGLGHHRILRDRGVIRRSADFLRQAALRALEARAG
jgi:pimeloyl-ACP methyl ester carboxylesterase